MKALTLAALIAAAPVATLADTLTLTAPLAGGTLHTDAVDMSVYYTAAEGDAFDVTAKYVVKGGESEPRTLRMRLEEGDSVVFGLPGHSGASWNFARSNGALTVAAEPLYSQLALN